LAFLGEERDENFGWEKGKEGKEEKRREAGKERKGRKGRGKNDVKKALSRRTKGRGEGTKPSNGTVGAALISRRNV